MFEVPNDFREPLTISAVEAIEREFKNESAWWTEELGQKKMPLVYASVNDLQALRRDSERINEIHELVTKTIQAIDRALDCETLYGKIYSDMVVQHFQDNGEVLIAFGQSAYGGGKILRELSEAMSQSGGSLRGGKLLAISIAWKFQERKEAITFGQTDEGEPSTKFGRIVRLMIEENGLHSHWRRASEFAIEFVSRNPSTNI